MASLISELERKPHSPQRTRSPLEVVEDIFPNDEPSALMVRMADQTMREIERAVSSPAMLTGIGAGDLATLALGDFITGIAPLAAGPRIIELALSTSLGHAGAVVVPGYVVTAADAGAFVAEGSPIPVKSMSLSTTSMLLRKLSNISAFTAEEAQYSDFEARVRSILSQAIGLAIDTEMFSSAAATAVRPGGLLFALTSLSPKSGGGEAAFFEDCKTLVEALAANGGGRDYVFVCSPGTALAAKGWAKSSKFDIEILSSVAVTKNTIIAVEVGAFFSAFNAVPEFSTSRAATVQLEDTTPAEIVSATGPTTANPVRSLWQTNCVALRTTLRCCFGMRSSGLVQKIDSVTW